MAAAGISGNQSTTLMQGLDGELICGVCLELFTTPVMLPCSHNFCEQCIYGIIETGMSFSFISIGPPRSFNCPICQAVINLNKFNQNGLVVNKALASIVALYKSCAPVDIFDSAWNSDIEVTPGMCLEHEKPQDRYCDSCSVAVCSQCEKTKHRSSKAKHRVEPLKHATVAYQTEIAEILTDLKKKLIPLNDRVHQLETTLGTIQDNQESISRKLEQDMSALMAHLRQRQEGLKRKLTSEMQARQRPVTVELERCRAIKVNVQELMKKLSQIRTTQDPSLKLKLMKDTCKQLTTVLCFDIDVCLQNPHLPDAGIPAWDLSIQEVIEAVSELDWKLDQGPARVKCKETGIQTAIEEAENLTVLPVKPLHSDSRTKTKGGNWDKLTANNKNSGDNAIAGLEEDHTEPGPRSPEQTQLDSRSFDEIDGDYPNCGNKVSLLTENGTKLIKKNVGDTYETETRSKQGIEREKVKEFGLVGYGDEDLNEKFKSLEITSSSRTKGRSSFPMESPPVIGNKNSNGRPKVLATRTKKSYSDKDLNKGERSYSPSNAEVLAKFVARRRTMSPAKSFPTLKALDGALNDTEESDLGTKKNASFPALKSSSKTFAGTESEEDQDIFTSLPALTAAGGLPSEDTKQSQDVMTRPVANNVTEKRRIEEAKPFNLTKTQTESTSLTNTQLDITKNQPNITKTQSDITNSQPDITGTQPEITNNHSGITNSQPDKNDIKLDKISSQPDLTDTQSNTASSHSGAVSAEEISVSLHHKPFSKQPIGVNLDFNMGLDETLRKVELKRITEV